MKTIKKVITLLLAAVMVLAMSATSFALESDTAISVSGLEAGDTASFYQVLKYDSSAKDTGGWVAAPGFTSLTKDEIQKILGLGDYATGESKADQAGIDETLAAKIADMAEATMPTGAVSYLNISESGGKAEKANPEAGLYVATITPGKAGFVYNPVFVGADYNKDNTSQTWAVDLSDSYQPASMAKKAKIELDKTAQDAQTIDGTSENYNNKSETVGVGDEVTFTVKTTIPEFANNYTNPVFKVSDVLSTGLELKQDSIKVYPTHDAITDETEELAAANYQKSDLSATGYTVQFKENYLLGLNAAQPITIQYKATVTSSAATSVNKLDNKVTVNYSNNPTDTTGNGVLKDITNHYTFDIDANILGGNDGKGTEVVKVGLDKDGKEITETKELDNGNTVGALQGAEFELFTDQSCAANKKYTNTILTADKKIVSDANGYLTIQGESTPGIRGLDAGTYWLKETKAPDGYIAAQDPVKIEIIPTFTDKTYKETLNGKEVTYQAKELASYIIKIDGQETASYTFNNAAVASNEPVLTNGDTADGVIGNAGAIGAEGATAAAAIGKIQNTRGVELPSTGGMGTIIFYTLGALLVIGCGIVLISKRRLQKNK